MTPDLTSTVRPTLMDPPAKTKPPASGPTLVFSSTNLRAWVRKSAFSLIDQGLTSGAGFGVNIFLARWASAEVYGAFAVAFAAFLFVSGFHSVLSLEPLSVFGPSRYSRNLTQYFRAQLVVHAVLVGALSTVVLLATFVFWRVDRASSLLGATMGGAVAMPFLLLLWLARRMCYVVQRPAIAVAGSSFYLAFITAGLFLLGHFKRLGAFSAFLLMGSGSLVAVVILMWSLGLLARQSSRGASVSWKAALRENWSYGRWLVGSAILFSVSSQTQMFLVAGSLGLGAAGILRAMQIPSLVMTQAITATGLLVLPTLSYDFGQGLGERMRHKAVLVSVGLFAVAICFAGMLTAGAPRVEHTLFGGKYVANVSLMPILALIPVANGLTMGFDMALRASQKPRFDLISNLFAAPIAILSAFFFIRIWGLAGAASSILLSSLVTCAVTMFFFYRSNDWKLPVASPGASS